MSSDFWSIIHPIISG